MERELEDEARLSFRDQLRDARAHALRDAEAFGGLLFCIERLLCKLSGRTITLGDHEAKPLISELANWSPLASDISSQ